MFCTKCGREVKEGTRFCTGCGTSVAEFIKAEPKEEVIEHYEEQSFASAKIAKPNLFMKIKNAGTFSFIMIIVTAAAITLSMLVNLFGSESFGGMLNSFGMSMCGYIIALLLPIIVLLHTTGDFRFCDKKKLVLAVIITLAVQATAAIISAIVYMTGEYTSAFHWINGASVFTDMIMMGVWGGKFRFFLYFIIDLSLIGKNVMALIALLKEQ